MKSIVFVRLLLLLCSVSFASRSHAQSVSGVINSYYQVTAINVVPNSITVSNASGLTPGVKVLIIQMKGAVINQANSASFGDITSSATAGNYEFNYICGIVGNNVLLQNTLLRSYDAAGAVQLITVPRYTSVTIADTVRAPSWDATTGTGGIVVIEAADTVYLNSSITVSGMGFDGGANISYPTPTYDCIWTTNITSFFLSMPPSPNNYHTGGWKGEGIANYVPNAEYGKGKQANGGGGGNNHNTGGGGGSNYGAGGNGGNRSNESAFNCHGGNPGIGGISLSSYGYTPGNNRIFMGGGGGTAHMNNNKGTPGGHGGGIIIVTANVLRSGGGRLLANGDRPYKAGNYDPNHAEGDGGGGGGGGGTIILNTNIVSGPVTAEVKGAAGSWSTHFASTPINDCLGPGGGGGGGVVWAKGISFPVTITDSLGGGANGIVSPLSGIAACRNSPNGATAGAPGARLTGYVAPTATTFTCAPLSASGLLSFEGRIATTINLLTWRVSNNAGIVEYTLQRSFNQVDFQSIETIDAGNTSSLHAEDKAPGNGTVFYRLIVSYRSGETAYSKIIALKRTTSDLFEWVNMRPNPAQQTARVVVNVLKTSTMRISVVSPLGQQVYSRLVNIKPGINYFDIPVSSLFAGVYFVAIEAEGQKQVRKLLVQSAR